jgi:peptide/nickel transport system substrate-binding protein
MINRHTRIRVRRRIRSRKKQVSGISENANKQLDRHVFRRWHNLKEAKRFMFAWILLLTILIFGVVLQTRALGRYYLAPAPTNGGVYTEGIEGNFSNANPIYAQTAVDSAVSRLVFAGLLTYSPKNQLTGDLAASWEVDSKATTYTVRLRPNLVWQDGKPLTADDVVFTYKTIQNPDAKSPLRQGWANINVEKVNTTTIKFTLPSAYSPFPHSLVTGILPEHILKDVPAAQLRSSSFNNKEPIGAGPFKWQSINVSGSGTDTQVQRIQLVRFDDFRNAPPKLDGITIYSYAKKELLLQDFDSRKIIGAVGVSDIQANAENGNVQSMFTQTTATMIFMKNSHPVLADVKVRQALASGTKVPELISKVGYPVVPVDEPLLKSHLGYNSAYTQRKYDKAEAERLLNEAGWVMPAGKNIREKAGQKLEFNFVTESNSEYTRIVESLEKQWSDIGVKLNISLQSSEDIAQSYILAHNYDILLYGVNLGADPDVYPYWHSSQADVKSVGKLNLSEYKSKTADIALEAGRTRTNDEIRAAKYKPFLEVWKNDTPAIGLYQPNLFFVSNQLLFNMGAKTINTPADRYNDAHMWMINTERALK